MSVVDPNTYDTDYDEAKEILESSEKKFGDLTIAKIGGDEIYFYGKRLGRNYIARIEEDGTLFVDDETNHGEFIVNQLSPKGE